MSAKLSLPNIQGNQMVAARNDMKLLAPTPMQLTNRNPIAHGGGTYTRYLQRSAGKSKRANPTDHDRSIFTNTTYFRSFYIIHPDWTSEGAGVRRLRNSSRPRVHYSWDRRPAAYPTSNYLGTLVQRHAQQDQQQHPEVVNLTVPQPPATARTQSSYKPLETHSYDYNRSFLQEKSRSGFF